MESRRSVFVLHRWRLHTITSIAVRLDGFTLVTCLPATQLCSKRHTRPEQLRSFLLQTCAADATERLGVGRDGGAPRMPRSFGVKCTLAPYPLSTSLRSMLMDSGMVSTSL